MTDKELIEWVARAETGVALPFDMTHGEVFDRLAALGCPLEKGQPVAVLAPRASAWAREHGDR